MANMREICRSSPASPAEGHSTAHRPDRAGGRGNPAEIAFESRHLRELCEEWEKCRATRRWAKSADDVSIPLAQWGLRRQPLPEANPLHPIERDARAIGRTLHVKGGVALMRHVLDMAAINEPFRGAVSGWWTGIGYKADIWMK